MILTIHCCDFRRALALCVIEMKTALHTDCAIVVVRSTGSLHLLAKSLKNRSHLSSSSFYKTIWWSDNDQFFVLWIWLHYRVDEFSWWQAGHGVFLSLYKKHASEVCIEFEYIMWTTLVYWLMGKAKLCVNMEHLPHL